MKKIKITNRTSDVFRKKIINFIKVYGDGHITKRTINFLVKTQFSKLNLDSGDLIHVIIDSNNKICGVVAIIDYGLEHAIIVVKPQMRKKGLANKLISEALLDIDRLYTKVAIDNTPSIKHCFSIGMQAFKLTKGPTGKMTLVFGFGNWSKTEWENHNC